jgi:pyruvate,orthophosphate dikinase
VRARARGAQGIGLCRTEHQFLGERRKFIESVILAETSEQRDAALEALVPLQRGDFEELLSAMDGLPTTIRLIDPPLHEFLPDLTELSVQVALAERDGGADEHDKEILAAIQRTHEANPMLGLRGVRLGLKIPSLFALQIRAIAEATVALIEQGRKPKPEIMVPLIGSVRELQIIRDMAEGDHRRGRGNVGRRAVDPDRLHDRAAAGGPDGLSIAEEADFFSFGTNDLTQTTWGFSRDDVESGFFAEYLEKGVLTINPFETIDALGVGSSSHRRREGRAADRSLERRRLR